MGVIRNLLVVMLILATMGVATLNLTVDDTARIGQSIGAKIIVDDGVNPIANLSCTVYTSTNGNDMLDIYTYDELLNNPASLKTNAGGYAFYNIPIDVKYPTAHSIIVYAYCGNQTDSATFSTLPYSPDNPILNIMVSFVQSPVSWIYVFVFAIVIMVFLKKGFKR